MNAVRYITTRSGVRIGSAWTPPPARIEGDATRIQSALLDERTARPQTVVQRLVGRIWSWL